MFWRPNILRICSSHNVQNNSLYRSSLHIILNILSNKKNLIYIAIFPSLICITYLKININIMHILLFILRKSI